LCGSNAPTAPQSVPTQSRETEKTTALTLNVDFLPVESPSLSLRAVAFDSPMAFASASQHCIALGKLQV
jgi:hypothetical protein